ncbi:monofunctional biosynthetic peptidoglycan transglycosylase [Thioclava sp. F1Mire-8]|uniref:monofunctional biosynthetic peptidoglycan transglycosylase n=1 Tax=Thioclava sp. F1Mire-8 TaxID=1973006 RepID=UPI000B54268F|nr:monofunctional biosynthetic peptidoglycan transglycosylase [Thioclava sp. F1Mire-8]OWY02901.1 monofunctional biosynthetic peptidoglycan transglycosylase [Thioclava sp. F1Mire-8]
MAKSTKKTGRKPAKRSTKSSVSTRMRAPFRGALRWALRGLLGLVALVLVLIVLFKFVNPPTTWTIWSERQRLGAVDQNWVPLEDIAPVLARSVVAAEDANFCNHWGFDMRAIRKAIDDGANRGASTITQQTVKNVFLWQGRSWLRKALEASMTPLAEAIWGKRRILEIYLNVAEFDEGAFGVDAAAHRYFRSTPDKLSARQSALIAGVLPDPKDRSAAKPGSFLSRRARSIMDGAATIQKDGRASCFE